MGIGKHLKKGQLGFGTALRYNSDRGFGFVSNVLESNKQSYFLHISVVKMMEKEKADQLEDCLRKLSWSTMADEKQYFWYLFESTSKGLQVAQILSEKEFEAKKTSIQNKYHTRIEELKKRFGLCCDAEKKLLKSLLSNEEYEALENQLKSEKEARARSLQEQLRVLRAYSLRQVEQERPKEKETKSVLSFLASLSVEEREFQALVAEMRPLNFRESSEVSEYITKNFLGHKYAHISGHLRMQNTEGREYIFNGGIKKEWYARLCSELKLTDRRSGAIVLDFESYADIKKNKY